jgi:hypothetical protein
VVCTGLVWVKIGTSGELLWKRYWTLGIYKLLRNYRVATQLVTSLVVLSSIELVSYLLPAANSVTQSVIYNIARVKVNFHWIPINFLAANRDWRTGHHISLTILRRCLQIYILYILYGTTVYCIVYTASSSSKQTPYVKRKFVGFQRSLCWSAHICSPDQIRRIYW